MVMNIYYIILDIFAIHIHTTLDSGEVDDDFHCGGGGVDLCPRHIITTLDGDEVDEDSYGGGGVEL